MTAARKTATVFLNGIPPAPRSLPPETELKKSYVICADGAYDYVKTVTEPSLVVGDFDSVRDADGLSRDAAAAGFEILRHPADKNLTDGHLALKAAAERGIKKAEIYGAFGGRPDLELSNYSLLALCRELKIDAVLRNSECDVRLLYGRKKPFVYAARRGATVSVIPFSGAITITGTKGLKYVAENLTLDAANALSAPGCVSGVSNEATASVVEIAVKRGKGLLFIYR